MRKDADARLRSCTPGPLIASLIAAAIASSSALPAGETLEQGFLNPPAEAYPGGGVRIAASAEAVRGQLESQKKLGIRQLAVSSDGAPGAYLSDEWRNAFATTASVAESMGFEISFMTSPGFSHTGDSRVQPEEAMKKLVWSETVVQGGGEFSAKLAMPPRNSGPFQNIPYFNESPWTIAVDRDFYRDVAVVAYRVPNSEVVTALPTITSSKGAIDAKALTANDPRKPAVLDSGSGPPWLQLDYATPQTIRSAVLATPETLFEESAVADLTAKIDGAYKKIAAFNMRSAAQVTISFPAVRSSSFRFSFSRLPQSVEPLVPKGSADAVPMDMSKLPFGPKRPPGVFAISSVALLPDTRVNEFERKAGFFTFVNDYYALATRGDASEVAIAKSDVIDLTDRMQADGTLKWTPPPGRWTVLRIGYSLTGKINHPAPPDATGLEVDKLSAAHMTKYLNRYLGFLPARDARKAVTTLFADSIESGPQNWTDNMFVEFQKRRGYDLHPFMPALTGAIVQSASATDKFLWDYRQTIADLIHENTYGKISELAHARGLKTRVQALEQARHQLGDDFEMRRYADEPMGALWGSADPVVDYLKEYPNQVADQRGAASVAHVYGRKIVAAESGTTLAYPGAFSPRVLKQIVDLEFSQGVNWLSHGSLSPRDPWANYGAEWMRYLARTSFMLQQGYPVADVAYFYGQDAPLVTLRERLNDAPRENAFDYINTQALLNLMSVKDGELVTHSGMQYRVLQLGGSSTMMTVNVLERIRELVQSGLIVVGKAPTDTPSLADDASEFQRLREELWGADGKGRKLGRGRVYGVEAIAQALTTEKIAPDVMTTRGKVGDTILFQHRNVEGGDFYFVMNRRENAGPIELSFRQSGKAPELWRADSGERTALSYRFEKGRTVVPADLRVNDAFFVVFRNATDANRFDAPSAKSARLAELNAWTVNFSGKEPKTLLLPAGSWTENADPTIKYFVGTAVYSRSLTLPADALNNRTKIKLDLGEVQDIADVNVNGTAIGVRWTPPYVFDITPAIKSGENKIEIKVTNRAVNALIAAAKSGAPQPFGGYKPDAPLRASGLIGPVFLTSEH